MVRLLLCLATLLTYPFPLMAGYKDLDYVNRPITDDVFYFVMLDRFFDGDKSNNTGAFEISEDKLFDSSAILQHGYWPKDKGYYMGGDFKGLTEKLDYLKGMGITALWLSPVQKNKAVQGGGKLANSSAGYHGYWVTDFTSVDPHFGDEVAFKKLVDTAHSKGMKVFIDVIVNHTADIIHFKECADCSYRSVADYPYSQSKVTPKINPGFDPKKDHEKAYEFLKDPNYAYTPVVAPEDKNIKKPSWLNNPIYYHNRGNSTFAGENSLLGDFYGLDDLFTEHPRVVSGMIDIYKDWITKYKIDGFRLDTVKHVNIEFWQAFVPGIINHAKKEGLPQFFVFGEVFSGDPKVLSYYTRNTDMPSVLDFALHGAITNSVTGLETDNVFEKVIYNDDIYRLNATPNKLMNFASNHDLGRIGHTILKENPKASDQELIKRTTLAQSLLFFNRGIPVIYYGDEQGFTGDGGDKDAREPMFASQVEEYNDNKLIGTKKTTADVNFDTRHPLYRDISDFSKVYKSHKALRSGEQVILPSTKKGDGLFAFTRSLSESNETFLIVYNFSNKNKTYRANIISDLKSVYPKTLKLGPDGKFEIDALSFAIVSGKPTSQSLGEAKPGIKFTHPKQGSLVSDLFYLEVALEGMHDRDVRFSYKKTTDEKPTQLHTDPSPPYRTYIDGSAFEQGQQLEVFANVKGPSGREYTAKRKLVIDSRQPVIAIDYQNGNQHTHAFFMSDQGGLGILSKLNGNAFSFPWPTNSKSVTVIYGSIKKQGKQFVFDQPIEISYADDISQRLQSKKSSLVAQLNISNQGEIQDQQKWQKNARPQLLSAWSSSSAPFDKDLFVRGGMNTWEAKTPMTYLGAGHYKTSVFLSGGKNEFKVADSSWSAQTNFGSPITKEGLTASGQSGNLFVLLPKDAKGNYELNFFQMKDPSTNQGNSQLRFIAIHAANHKSSNDLK